MTAFNPHEYLNSFANFESQLHQLRPEDFQLNRIEKFLDLAGNPAKALRIIHVAGTKGKGSTCLMMARILQEAGYKVGLYTSPHLHCLNERIRILSNDNLNSKDDFSGSIADEEIGFIVNFLQPFTTQIQNAGEKLTYFEVLTVIALTYFFKNKVDVVVLETGLGGRLDATNAVDSKVAVITPISYDHTKILGSTLSKIAFEKAGIIKNSHQKVVIAPQEPEAMKVIVQRCQEFGIEPVIVSDKNHPLLKISLAGEHQQTNALVAIEAVKQLGLKMDDEAILNALKHLPWPGRFELLKNNPDVIVDCAHNDASAQALALTIREKYPKKKVNLILGISQDKDIATICKYLNPIASKVFLTKAQHPRAHTFVPEEAKNYFADKSVEIMDNLSMALGKTLKQAKKEDVILITGSVFIVAEAREKLGTVPN